MMTIAQRNHLKHLNSTWLELSQTKPSEQANKAHWIQAARVSG